MTTQTVALDQAVVTTGAKARNIALWALQIGVAGMFFMAGGHKLTGDPQMVGLFDAIGIGQWFRYFTGLSEVSGALSLLIPSLAGLGALQLVAVMTGAVATHLFIIGGSPVTAIVLLVSSAIIAYGRRERTLSLLRRFTDA
jgi:hypothetical protein